MGWICKISTFVVAEANELLRPYRLRHNYSEFLPRLHVDCPCSFKTWNALKSHLSRKHSTEKSVTEIEEELRRITLKRLLSTFLGKLDQFSPKLLSLYRRKGGAVGKKLEMLDEDNSIESRREAVIRGLILYLGEKIEDLIKDYQIYGDDDAAAVQDALRHWSSVSLWSEKLGAKGRGKLG
ncbi:hypothetical protein ILYODFUR_022065 [Ilyodon furcidens]|uniref:C2H2-type domain-containing protein n=1 Tax=Ilyodon furcidens TaxID=33524 RepID=A0ABV0UV86_9TELE